MDFKRMRLKNLVNIDFNFYPRKGKMDESDLINRYDSDEEKDDSEFKDDDAEFDLDGKESPLYNNILLQDKISVKKIEAEMEGDNLDSAYQTAKKSLNPNLKYNTYSNFRTTEKKSKRNFEKLEGDYINEEILFIAENLNLSETSKVEEVLEDFMNELEKKMKFENLDSTIFFTNIFHYFTNKLSLHYLNFDFKKDQKNEENDEITQNYCENPISTHSINPITISLQNIKRILTTTQKLFFIILKLLSIKETNKNEEYGRIIFYMISIYDNLLEMQLKLNISVTTNYFFIPQMIKLILLISENYQNEIFKDPESFYFLGINSRLKNIFFNCNFLFSTNNFIFKTEDKKDLFIISFNLIKEKSLINIYLPLVQIICNIINCNSGEEFIEKFIEYLLSYFNEFIDHYNFTEDKFYQLDKRILSSFKNYFGVYKCFNGDTISLFTLLFLKIFSIIYSLDNNELVKDQRNQTNFFNKNFEIFIFKIFEAKKNSLLLIIFCLYDDLINIKYNIEFSISLVILTNMFLCFSNLIIQNDLEINKRKFFLNLFEIFMQNLLSDFKNMKDFYLCLGNSNSNHDTNSCHCFSCSFVNKNIIAQNTYFICAGCGWKTNLRLQIINPENDDSKDICGFCNMRNYFESSSGDLFSKEKISEANLIETNEEIIEEYSKNKLLNKNDDEINDSSNEFLEKFLKYQDSLYKNSFTFIRGNILNFLINFNKNSGNFITSNLDVSFKIFLKILISDQKISTPLYKNFNENIQKLYENLKSRIFNSLPDLIIDDSTINYFYFYYFYTNFLFAGHWRIVDILFNDQANSSHWFVRLKSLKILEQILIFEGEDKIFQNFHPEMLGLLISDSSFYVKEYSLEILFKLFKFKKISKSNLLNILYDNVDESSFLIRKRIIKALIGLVFELKDDQDKDHFKTINYIFLNKIIDNSESNKIKNMIFDFYFDIFSLGKKNTNLISEVLNIFVEILKDHEDVHISNSNMFLLHIKNLFTFLIQDKKLKEKDLMNITDYIFSNFILNRFELIKNNKGIPEEEKNENYQFLIQSLNLIKIISNFNSQFVVVYFETLLVFLKINDENEKNNIDIAYQIEAKFENKIKQIVCEINGNILNASESNVKNKHIYILEIYLIKIILSKPSPVMISAINCYSKIISRGIVSHDKIRQLTYKNFEFLKGQMDNLLKLKENPKTFAKNKIKKLISNPQEIPLPILSKSLTLLAYITYCSEIEDLKNIFSFMTKEGSLNENNSENLICENIFNIYKTFIMCHPNNSIKFRTFEALGFYWIRFPHKLSHSKEIIQIIFHNISNDEEKLIILRTFIIFFEQIILQIKIRNDYDNSNLKVDFGGIHLFFEQFINNFSSFMVSENNSLIRIQAIQLIKLIVELGNINVHVILPYIFAALFDYVDEIRHIAVGILEKIIKISKDKFFNFMKDNLKMSFNFQKRIYTMPNFINSFVKIKQLEIEEQDSSNSFENQNENIFELFSYKISKSLKDENFNKKILSKFIQTFQEIKNIENEVNLDSIQDCISKFEFYEFVANLIADFKFTKSSEIFSIFQILYKDYDNELLVFQTKLKEFRDSSQEKVENKLIINFFSVCLKSSLFKFMFSKYENLDYYENIIKKDFENFREVLDSKEYENNKGKKNSNLPLVSKELKNIKFYQFYNSTLCYLKIILKFTNKNKGDKIKCVESMKNIKEFEKMKISNVRSAVVKFRKNLNKLKEEKANELLCNLLFEINSNGPVQQQNDKKQKSKGKIEINSKQQITEQIDKISNISNINPKLNNTDVKNKLKKRVSLDELDDKEDEEVKTEKESIPDKKNNVAINKIQNNKKKKENNNKRRKTHG